MFEFRSAVRALPDYDARDMSDAGVRVRAHRNEAAFAPPNHVIEAVRSIDPSLFGRYPSAISRKMIKALSKRLDTPRDQLAIGNGADELLLALSRIALDPGDNVLLIRPAFGMYGRAAALAGATIRELRHTRRWVLDPPALVKLSDNRTKLVFLGHPNNPTGETLSPDALEFVAAAIPQALVIVDETYLSFAGTSLIRYAGAPTNVVIVGSLSKVCALAGMRVGYAAAAPQVARMLRRVIAPYPVGLASLVAADAYLRGGRATVRFEERMKRQISKSLATIVLSLKPFAAGLWSGPGNFILVELDRDAKPVAKALRRCGIGIRTFTDPILARYMRLCALDDAGTSELVRGLRSTLAVPLQGVAR
jgi:histidinol-phosphate aminotransferase